MATAPTNRSLLLIFIIPMIHHNIMLSNETINNALYDSFFLEQTFNSPQMLSFSKKEIEWLKSAINLKINSRIIDVACGSGRHLNAFLDLGFTPTGVDSSPDCIKLAKANCPSLASNIFETDFLKFSELHLSEFDLVFIGGGSFGYDPSLQINQKYLKALLILATDSAYLAIQFINKQWAELKIKNGLTFWTENESLYTLDKRKFDGRLLSSEKIFIKKDQLFQKKYSDVIYTFTQLELLKEIEHISGAMNRKFEMVMIQDSFSSKTFNEVESASPVLILKRVL